VAAVGCTIDLITPGTAPAQRVIDERMQDRAHALGLAIRERRRALGLLQAELGELAACSTRFVHTLEAGKATVRLDKVLDVLRVLGLGLEVVRGEGGITAETRAAGREG
jgi:HTH-type transcriptional regulator / antitoxin HipB